MNTKEKGRRYIDCHIELISAENTVRSNDRHSVDLCVWYKIIDVNDRGFRLDSCLNDIQISFVDFETGNPLTLTGWRWSLAKEGVGSLKQGERVSLKKPDSSKIGYMRKVFNLSRITNHECQGPVSVGVRAHATDCQNSGEILYGQSEHRVVIHQNLPNHQDLAELFDWSSFNVSGPIYSHEWDDKDTQFNWTIDDDDNYRFANFLVTFKDTTKSVTKATYGGSTGGYAPNIYSIRRRNGYEIAAYIWDVDAASQGPEQKTIHIAYSPGVIVEKPIWVDPSNGFVITLVCYPHVDGDFVAAWDDSWCSDNKPSDIIHVRDNTGGGTDVDIQLNQAIPVSWPLIKNNLCDKNSQQTFSSIALGNNPIPLPYAYYRGFNLKNYKYGYVTGWGAGFYEAQDTPHRFYAMNYSTSEVILLIDAGNNEGNSLGMAGYNLGPGFIIDTQYGVFLMLPYWDVKNVGGSNDLCSGFLMLGNDGGSGGLTIGTVSGWFPIMAADSAFTHHPHTLYGKYDLSDMSAINQSNFVWAWEYTGS
jgi:hypothetical protein